MGKITLKTKTPMTFKATPQPPPEIFESNGPPAGGQRTPNMWDTMSRRMQSYGALVEQLDEIWHDIDNGKILADTDSPGTWYMKVKHIKEAFPISNNPAEFTSNTEILNS